MSALDLWKTLAATLFANHTIALGAKKEAGGQTKPASFAFAIFSIRVIIALPNSSSVHFS